MEKEMFSPMAIDALGEMMNISLGSSATAVSNMLDHRVDITTPTVSVVDVKDFSLGNLEPAIGVEIKYVEGLEGSNIMLLKRSDIKVIVDILMGMETADEEFELNELTISCVCEVMNQMMGSAATAMSDFLGFRVDISTPVSFELEDLDQFKQEHLPQGADQIVVVRFFLKIEDALESEFMNVMSVALAKELLKSLGLEDEVSSGGSPAPAAPSVQPAPEASASNRPLSQEEIEAMLAGGGASAPAPAPAPAPESSNHMMSQEEIEAMLSGGAAAPAPEPAPASSGGDKKMSQDDIERMLAGMNSEPAPAPAPSGGGDHKMSQAEIEAMLAGGVPSAPPPAAAANSLVSSSFCPSSIWRCILWACFIRLFMLPGMAPPGKPPRFAIILPPQCPSVSPWKYPHSSPRTVPALSPSEPPQGSLFPRNPPAIPPGGTCSPGAG